MHNTGEIMQLCRLCLVKEQVNVPIFEGQGDVRQIFQKISSCLPVKINRSDKLPKNICDGCSEKLDLFYDFWNTSVNSEKQLLEWLGQTPLSAGAGTTIAAKNSTTKPTDPVQQIKVDVKQEPSDHTDNNESFQAETAMADDDETSFKEESAPPPKRARRAVTKRKPITVAPDSDDDDDDDYEPVEPLTKLEDESGNSDNDNDNDNEDDSFAAPSTSADDQPGPSGLGKDGVEAPIDYDDLMLIMPTERNPMIDPSKRDCKICKESFPTLADLKFHMKTHPNARPYECDLCEKRYRSEEGLRLHKRYHVKKPFKCSVCSKSFIQRFMLNNHMLIHEEDSSHPCTLCDKVFKLKRSLEHHHNVHHLKKFRILNCDQCGMGFRSSGQLSAHRFKDHGITNFVCRFCGKRVGTKSSLSQHELTHNEEKVYCDICQKPFADKYTMRKHKKIHNKDRKLYVCDLCGKVMTSSQSYKIHKMIHEGIKPHKCEFCDKSFVKIQVLKTHLVTHTGEKPFECKDCGNRYTQRTSLTIHRKKVHAV